MDHINRIADLAQIDDPTQTEPPRYDAVHRPQGIEQNAEPNRRRKIFAEAAESQAKQIRARQRRQIV